MGSQFVVWSEPWRVVNSRTPWNFYLTQIPLGGQQIL
jgi:hypothetical protein